MLQDLAFAFRTLARQKGFTTVAIAILALGIGGTTVMYGVVSGVLLQPLPYPQSQRLVRIWETWGKGDSATGSVSRENFDDWQAQSHTLEHLTAIEWSDLNLAKDGRAERLAGARVTAGFFPLLGIQPAQGRTFSSEAYGADNEVMLSYATWQRWFGGVPGAVGQTLALSDHSYTVVGVLPRDFRFEGSSLAVVLPLGPKGRGRGNHYLAVLARLAPGATVAQANADLDTIGARLEAAYPDTNTKRRTLVRSWHESLVAPLRAPVLLLFGAVVLVLLIACANVANMLLARAAGRETELAIRFALGASRWRVVRQLLTESAVLAALGAGAGILLAAWGVEACRALLPSDTTFVVSLDASVVGFALATAIASVLLFGLVPALRAAGGNVSGALKEGARTVTGGRARLKSALVVGQVALSFALLIGAGLLGKSFLRLAAVEPGFDPSHVATLQISLPPGKDPAVFYPRLLAELAAAPGVQSAGVVDFLPLSHNNINGSFEIEGRPFPREAKPITEYMLASPGYFNTMGMRIVAGRGLTPADRKDTRPVAVVNQTMARRYFPGESPIGKRLKLGWDETRWFEIVGIVNDTKRWSLAGDGVAETYVPFAQQPFPNMALAVRGPGDPAQLAGALRRAAATVDPGQAVYNVTTMTETIGDSLRSRRLLMSFLSAFAAIALALAAIGLYGLLAVQVAQRSHEIGIRMALGARAANVRALVVGHGLRLALGGVVVGAAAALLGTRLLSKMLYGVSSTDPTTFVAVAGALLAAALLATWLPARRATRIDPMIALRAS